MTTQAVRWGSEVVQGEYAGHPGLVYDVSPSCVPEVLEGTDRWNARGYVVQGERRISHGDFKAAIPRAAGLLARHGVQPGDRVLLLSYNSPEFMLAACAAWWIGAVGVYANRWWSDQELRHALDLTTPTLALSDAGEVAGLPTLDLAELRSLVDGRASEESVAAHPSAPDDAAVVLFTSGSSGAPKGVALSHRSVVANQHNLLLKSRRLPHQLADDSPQPVGLVCTPLFHVGGISNILNNLITGGRIVLTKGRFDPAEILQLIESEGVGSWGGVPTMAARVIEHPDFERYDLSTLRSFPLGGAPLPPALLERMTAKLPQLKERGLANTWGMTETGGFMTVAGNADLRQRPGTVGRPYPNVELRIDAPNESGSGEVLVRAPSIMLGYVGVDDGTVDADGWLHTGDLGHLDEDGFLYLDGRSKDIVIRGGENIACAHVEKALVGHPAVVEAAVFGIPHDDLGEELVAAVVHRPGDAVDAEELRAFLKQTLAYFEVPSLWTISDQPLPTLAGEKVDKKAVRAAFLAACDEGAGDAPQ